MEAQIWRLWWTARASRRTFVLIYIFFLLFATFFLDCPDFFSFKQVLSMAKQISRVLLRNISKYSTLNHRTPTHNIYFFICTPYCFPKNRCSPWKPKYGVFDEQHEQIAQIDGPCCICSGPCCGDVEFPVRYVILTSNSFF